MWLRTIAAVSLRRRLGVLCVVVGGGPGGRVRRCLRGRGGAPALVVAGPGAGTRGSIAGVRRLARGSAPALVPGSLKNELVY